MYYVADDSEIQYARGSVSVKDRSVRPHFSVFCPNLDVITVTIQAHSGHFIPAAVDGNATLISFVTNAISRSVTSAPVSAGER